MPKAIDYYLSLQSPWTYLGSARLQAMAAELGAVVNVMPINFGTIFPASGGLPLAKRAPQRQAYRLTELSRWRDHLGVALNLEPRFFPVDERAAVGLVIAARQAGADCLSLSHAVLRAVWAEERDIADPATLAAIADECGLAGNDLVAAADSEDIAETYRVDTESALARGVFGAPTYVYNNELFWGQDRLDFLERALRR